jgi:hypothetical protein
MTTVLEIEIDGRKYPVRYDALHFEEVELLMGKSYFDAIQNPSVKLYNALAYTGLKCGHHFKNGKADKFTKTYEEVAQWVPMNTLKEFFKMALKFTIPEESKDDVKSEGNKPGE